MSEPESKPPVLAAAKPIPVEVVNAADPSTAKGPDQAPVHGLSALVLLAVDNLWDLADWAVVTWVVTIPLSFLTVFIPVYFVQRHMRHDRPGRAAAIALLLGVLAAIPTSITGTPVGMGLLAWTGLRKYIGRPKP